MSRPGAKTAISISTGRLCTETPALLEPPRRGLWHWQDEVELTAFEGLDGKPVVLMWPNGRHVRKEHLKRGDHVLFDDDGYVLALGRFNARGRFQMLDFRNCPFPCCAYAGYCCGCCGKSKPALSALGEFCLPAPTAGSSN
jgi:hypothetical protein